MAQVSVEFSCGHPGYVECFGSRKDRESKASWIAERRVCEICFETQRDEKRAAEAAAAQAQAEEWELPALDGTEKQISWAQRIRCDAVKTIELIRVLAGHDEEFEVGVTAALSRREARFWIDEMRFDGGTVPLRNALQSLGRAAEIAATKPRPTVVVPSDRDPISVVEISHEPGEIRLTTMRKEGETLIDEIKDIGFRWSTDHWFLGCPAAPVGLDNVAAGIACEILALGYSVALPQPTVAELVAEGGFERDATRKLYAKTTGKAFLLRWRRSDDIFETVKSLPGARWESPYMRVPVTSANEVLDLADRLGFWISPAAAALAESLNVIEVKGEKVVLGLPSAVEASSLGSEIHADLRDY